MPSGLPARFTSAKPSADTDVTRRAHTINTADRKVRESSHRNWPPRQDLDVSARYLTGLPTPKQRAYQLEPSHPEIAATQPQAQHNFNMVGQNRDVQLVNPGS